MKGKKSILQCRHCQFKMQVPKIQKIREIQEKEYNFVQVKDWHFTKILSKKGRLINLMMADQKIRFQYMENDTNNILEIEVPQNKIKLLQKLKIQQIYRFKVKAFESKKVDFKKIFLKKSDQNSVPLKIYHKYQLISLSKSKP